MQTARTARPRRPGQGGFGTMEALVASVLSMLVALAIMGFFDAQQRAYATLSTYSESQNVTRTAIDLMSRELRMASYDPLGTAILPLSPGPTCTNKVQGLAWASVSRVEFKQDLDNSGAINGPNEDVIYSQSGDKIIRTDASGSVVLVEGVPNNGFKLRYFTGSPSVELTPSGSPPQLTVDQKACVNKIQIEINSEIPDPYPNKPAVHSTVRSTVAIRNRSIDTF